jgi:glycerophosphoryl diester phosphodiesterase
MLKGKVIGNIVSTNKLDKLIGYKFLEIQVIEKNELTDKIPTFEDFLSHFAHRDITFAIELKVGGVEQAVADMIFKYGIEKKTVVTSFELDYIRAMKKYAPSLKIGYLTTNVDDAMIDELLSMGADEICPKGVSLTAEQVNKWHARGLNVRAWGIADVDIMRSVYAAGADGMTVNFPDRLVEHIAKNK